MLKNFLRGATQVHVLHHAAERGVHGAWLSTELARHGYEISAGTLYPLLHRMEQSGLLVSHEEVTNGRVLRIYAATEAGLIELEQLRVAVAELADEVLVEKDSEVAPYRARDRVRDGVRAGAEPEERSE